MRVIVWRLQANSRSCNTTDTWKPMKSSNHWHQETYKAMKPMKPLTPWYHETYETMKPLTPRNLWNHDTIDTTKPMKQWHYETYKTMKPMTPQNLWSHETLDTTKPMTQRNHETLDVYQFLGNQVRFFPKSSILLVTPWTTNDNIKKRNIHYYHYLGDYSPGYRENYDVKTACLGYWILKWCFKTF